MHASRRWLVLLPLLATSACVSSHNFLAPAYQPDKLLVPASWGGESPFIEAKPSDGMIRANWWEHFDDEILNELELQAMRNNAELEAAAERFVQARDEMMRVRSRLIPHVGIGVDLSDNKQSQDALFRSNDSPIYDNEASLGGLASWQPDFFGKIRNATQAQIYRAEERAAQWALVRLSIQAELASAYFLMRGLDAQEAIYKQSIAYYEASLALVQQIFRGNIGSQLDVARAQYQLSSTQARLLKIQARRQVAEHAVAVLVNTAPAQFHIAPVEMLKAASFTVPTSLPSTLLERRPDVAAKEREMAQANRHIGIARAAFFPNIPLGANGGISGQFADLFQKGNFFWSVASFIHLPVFQGGARRAKLQQAWSHYRETEDKYRATVLKAFKEVEDGLSMTRLLTEQYERQVSAMEAAGQQQALSMDLYRGGLASSLELILAQVNTLESRIAAVEIKTELLHSTVALVRALGGGFSAKDLPRDEQIQPFGVLQFSNLQKPEPVGGINVEAEHHEINSDLRVPQHY